MTVSELDRVILLWHPEDETPPAHKVIQAPGGEICTCGEDVSYAVSPEGFVYVRQHYDTEHAPTTIPIEGRRHEPEAIKEPLEIPAPTIPQRLLDDKALTARTFPAGPKRAWKAAREAGHAVRATYSVGPWMSANFQSVLEAECPTVAVWIVKRDRSRVRALWICRGGKWAFESAWLLGIPLPKRLNSKEMTEWITAP